MPYSGFYVAVHPWPAAEGLCKVGHSADLRRRLQDGAYVTCFSTPWRFAWTFETRSRAEAARLEAAVLYCYRRAGLCAPAQELARAEPEAAASLAVRVAELLGIEGRPREEPEYPPPKKRASKKPLPPPGSEAGGLLGPGEREQLLRLCARLPREPADAAALAPQAECSSVWRSQTESHLPHKHGQQSSQGVESSAAAVGNMFENLGLDGADDRAPDEKESGKKYAGGAVGPERSIPDEEDEDFFDATPGGADVGLCQPDTGAGEMRPVVEEFHSPIVNRPYQDEAAERCAAELEKTGRAILQMACRTGKTRTAFLAANRLLRGPSGGGERERARCGGDQRETFRILYLVPGLALLAQTRAKLQRYADSCWPYESAARFFLVGSGGGGTTDPAAVASISRRAEKEGSPPAGLSGGQEKTLWVISTYQSSALLEDDYDLTIFDECHRVCGGSEVRPFTHVLLNHLQGRRLFLTATPRYDTPLSMSDRKLFGGVAFRYYLRAGIEAGYANDFALQLVAPSGRRPRYGDRNAPRAGEDELAEQIAMAYRDLQSRGVHFHAQADASGPGRSSPEPHRPAKLLVFARTIRQAVVLSELFAKKMSDGCGEPAPPTADEALARDDAGGVQNSPPEVLTAHSRQAPATMRATLEAFRDPDRPAVLFNCRLYQEGVEVPSLNGVFFAAPRHSPRDIIQSVCRPLNVHDGAGRAKPPSVIYLPLQEEPAEGSAACSAGKPSAGRAAGEYRYASILPFVDALASEDPRFFEHLLNPRGHPYPLGWVAPSTCSAEAGREMLAGLRRAACYGSVGSSRNRLLRPERIPWGPAFAELRRVVAECRRYPKTNDGFRFAATQQNGSDGATACFYPWYRWAAKAYFEGTLEPHQRQDLESLPCWTTRGVEGPYPWAEALAFLERWLEENGGKLVAIDINRGGWVGLDATPMERLSGVLTTVSQRDGRSRGRNGKPRPRLGFTIPDGQAADLDRVFGRWGLRWRKDRTPSGELLVDEKGEYAGRPTCIQEAYANFKRLAADPRNAFVQRHWPGYPWKHKRQELPEVWARGLAPPRYCAGGRLIARGRRSAPAEDI